MDLLSLVYSFVLLTGTGKFVVHEATPIGDDLVEIDVQTLGLHEDQRYILLVDHGRIVQQARVPLAETECANPH